MKMWVLAALITVVTIPVASALESTTDCQVDEGRRETRAEQRERTDPPASPAATASTARTTALASRDPNSRPEQQQRRRNGKRVPDAELIGPRGAL
jgi:hypothetical protein